MTTETAIGDGDLVATLFAERQRFEGWLSALESRKASTPQHIYDRVKTDYEGRLRGVMDQLRAQRSQVEARASSLSNRLAELESEAQQHEDERAEIELRASIGEIEPDQAESTRREAEQRLQAIGSEREQLQGELARLREILVASAEPAKAAAPVAEPPARKDAPKAAAKESSNFDELEFLKSVTDSRGTKGGLATETETAVDRKTKANGRPSGSVPVFLRDVQAEQTKTLKCQECATLNYPTEWYCERCGAELAAL